MSLRYRDHTPEMLDGDNISYQDMHTNLKELDIINSSLGGHAITLKAVKYFLDHYKEWDRPIVIAEIGCGGGDNLAAIRKLLISRGISYKLIGIDIKAECLQYAVRKNNDLLSTWICSDYRQVQWPDDVTPDIIFSSLFCHHFTDQQLGEQLKWMQDNSKLGFFINDLHRHPIAYYSIKILTALFSRSDFVKNDGPLSVKRAFIKKEWKALLHNAGIHAYLLTHEWAFRYLICAHHEQ